LDWTTLRCSESGRFPDRRAAGRVLAEQLERLGLERPVVLGLPRGGVPVAYEVASRLHAPLDVVVVRKVGAPRNRELAVGAVGEGGVRLLNERSLRGVTVRPEDLQQAIDRAEEELRAQLAVYRDEHAAVELAGRDVIVVDDGFATGSTARAAARVVMARGARRVVLAAPVGAASTAIGLRGVADEVVCPLAPSEFWSVGAWYESFLPVPDEEVQQLLAAARARDAADG
jgi:putative phosphoribosyl transferase